MAKHPVRKKWHERMVAAFGKGTFRKIELVLSQYEDRTDFVREAVNREIERRKAEVKK